MYVYTFEDFGSSGFTEITAITIHRIVFQASRDSRTLKMVDHGVTKIRLPPLFIPMIFGGCVFHILLPRYCDGSPCPRTLDETNFCDDDQSLRACLQGERIALALACKWGIKVTLVYKQISQVGLQYVAQYPDTSV